MAESWTTMANYTIASTHTHRQTHLVGEIQVPSASLTALAWKYRLPTSQAIVCGPSGVDCKSR